MTYSAVLFGADCVARSLQTTAGMLVARALSAPKTPRCLRHRNYACQHLATVRSSEIDRASKIPA